MTGEWVGSVMFVPVGEVEKVLSLYSLAYGEGWEFYRILSNRVDSTVFEAPVLGGVEVVQVVIGHEDDPGCWIVFKVTPYGGGVSRFFKKCGRVDSYDSTSWDGDFVEVVAREKTVVSYEYLSL